MDERASTRRPPTDDVKSFRWTSRRLLVIIFLERLAEGRPARPLMTSLSVIAIRYLIAFSRPQCCFQLTANENENCRRLKYAGEKKEKS